jgi:hypothetical protein
MGMQAALLGRPAALVLVVTLLAGAALGAGLTSLVSGGLSTPPPLRILASDDVGVNSYVMIEVDDGDNDERQEVTWTMHTFTFSTEGEASGLLTWDFGDGATAVGPVVEHAFETSGRHTVTVVDADEPGRVASVDVRVELQGEVVSDNMECTCAPTAKSTLVDLQVTPEAVSIDVEVRVEHEGSSESCSLRNPLQECHVRVLVERVKEGDVVARDEVFDATFRENELLIPFTVEAVDLQDGESLRLRLETDQLRDWHKPTTTWMTAV